MEKYLFNSYNISSINEEERTLETIVSTEEIDRHGDIVLSDEWDLEDFSKNPILLWQHNLNSSYDGLPIGKVLEIQKITLDNGIRGVQAKIYFSKDEFADRVFNLYREGVLKAFSIGFRALEYLDGNRNIITKIKLTEISSVPIPANQSALIKGDLMKSLNEEASMYISIRKVLTGLDSLINIKKHYINNNKVFNINEGFITDINEKFNYLQNNEEESKTLETSSLKEEKVETSAEVMEKYVKQIDLITNILNEVSLKQKNEISSYVNDIRKQFAGK